MTFEHLPPDWSTRPLTDPELALNVIDLVCSSTDRQIGGLAVLFTNADDTLQQPFFVHDIPRDCDQFDQARSVWNLAQVAEQMEVRGLAIAVCRRRGARQTNHDAGWLHALNLVCDQFELRNLGCFLATHDAVVRLGQRSAPRHKRLSA